MRTETVQRWQARWDRQQERYVTERDRRFGVIADVVAWSAARAGVAAPVVVDLGCGPGSLTRRVAAEHPGASVTGVDADPLLLALASGQDGGAARYARADLTDPSWPRRAGLTGTWDAAVSSTALHWLAPDDLGELYRVLAAHLRPGGVFVDSDHRRPATPAAADLAAHLSAAATRRDGRAENEDWEGWWAGVQDDPELGGLVDADAEVHHGSNGLTIEEQARMLHAAGFAEVTTAWQHGDDHVLVAVR